MKGIILIVALALAGCGMTPTQKRWTAIAVGVVATGALIAHEHDSGKQMQADKSQPFHPCPSGNSQSCK